MQSPMEQTRDSRAAERAMQVGGVVLGKSLMLIAVADRVQESGDLTVRLGLMCVGIGAALWGRSKAAGIRDTAAAPAPRIALPVYRAMIVVFILWLLTVFMDRSLAVWGRPLLLGVLGLLVVYAAMRPVRPPPSVAS
jgi:hypothetical protein